LGLGLNSVLRDNWGTSKTAVRPLENTAIGKSPKEQGHVSWRRRALHICKKLLQKLSRGLLLQQMFFCYSEKRSKYVTF
jgi:hypothetical protein